MTSLNERTHAGTPGRSSVRTGLRGAIAVAAMAGVLAVAGCREAEQDRPLDYEPGTYLGQEDQPIGEETLDTLRERARRGQQL